MTRYNTATKLAAINRFAASFPNDPAEYARQVLRVQLTPQQRKICRAIVENRKVLVKASHNVGKTFLAAVITSWFFDSFRPGICLTTAPTDQQVRDLLWKEVRVLRGPRGGFRGPKMPRLEDAPDHWAHGFTSRDGDSFQGRHSANMLIIFDEATGVDPTFWETAKSMYGGNAFWLCIFNPTNVSSQPYREERNSRAGWHTMTMSALDHPNVRYELAGREPPIPGAMSLARLNELLDEWCEEVHGPTDEGDFEWPPNSGRFLRPGPIADARLLGRYPRSAVNTVWSDALIERVLRTHHELDPTWPVQIGVDVAHYGDDFTAFHIRQGKCSLHHEEHNGWPVQRTAQRAKDLAQQFHGKNQHPKRVPIVVDTGGGGIGVWDLGDDFNFVGVNAGETSQFEERYKNTRTELWFTTAELAKEGMIDLSRLSSGNRITLAQQLIGVEYNTKDALGRYTVEPKADTKKRNERSPDSADAFNLAYWVYREGDERIIGRV